MKIVRCLVVFVLYLFTDDGIFLLFDAQMQMTARVVYIIRITRITLKFIHNALLVTSEGFVSVTFKSSEIFLLAKTGCHTRSIFFPRSLSCLRTVVGRFLGPVVRKQINLTWD